jgi:hypothetical protein
MRLLSCLAVLLTSMSSFAFAQPAPASPARASARVRVDLPPGWQTKVPPLKNIVQYAVDYADVAAFELLVEPKSDFAKGVDLMAWAKMVKKANDARPSKLAERKETELRERKVSGKATVEYGITGETKLANLHYRIIMVEAGDHFCRLVCWTNPSHWEQDQAKFDDLVGRLKVTDDKSAGASQAHR